MGVLLWSAELSPEIPLLFRPVGLVMQERRVLRRHAMPTLKRASELFS
jgi:hypothetical protein